MEGGVSTAAGTQSIQLGLLSVNHASWLSDWLDWWMQNARLLPPHHVDDVTGDTDGGPVHALKHSFWAQVHRWPHGCQYHLSFLTGFIFGCLCFMGCGKNWCRFGSKNLTIENFLICSDSFPTHTACNPQFRLKMIKITLLPFSLQIKNVLKHH